MLDEDFIKINVDAYIRVIKDMKADVVVDFWNPFACIAARSLNVLLVTVIQADMHPESEGFIWWKDKPHGLPSPKNTITQVLDYYNLPPIKQTGELFLGDRTIVIGIPELDPLPKSADVTYVGPIIWQQEDSELPHWINQLDQDLPIVWLYPGNLQYASGFKTAFDSQIVLDACIQAFSGLNLQIILSTGHHQLPPKYRNLPQNFYFAPYLPGISMAQECDLLIHHGGYGSCQTGLFTGTPSLVIPTFSERESNARRIAAVKAGEYVLPNSGKRGVEKWVDPIKVRDKALRILSDPAYLENARIIQKKLETRGGALQAAKIIDDLIS
jgi:UDP:flavonoid glycosyltransferase YjiC (YdhE family)